MLNCNILKDNKAKELQIEVWDFRASLQCNDDLKGWWDDTKLHLRAFLKAVRKMKCGIQKAKLEKVKRKLEKVTTWKEQGA
jgi:hypothetical protein